MRKKKITIVKQTQNVKDLFKPRQAEAFSALVSTCKQRRNDYECEVFAKLNHSHV